MRIEIISDHFDGVTKPGKPGKTTEGGEGGRMADQFSASADPLNLANPFRSNRYCRLIDSSLTLYVFFLGLMSRCSSVIGLRTCTRPPKRRLG